MYRKIVTPSSVRIQAIPVTGNAKDRNQFSPFFRHTYSRKPARQTKSIGRKIIGRNRGNSSGNRKRIHASAEPIST